MSEYLSDLQKTLILQFCQWRMLFQVSSSNLVLFNVQLNEKQAT